MDTALDQVLRLVAEGRLTADEAAPILDELDRRGPDSGTLGDTAGGQGIDGSPDGDGATRPKPRFARIEVSERGRRVVDLRIPISLGRAALERVPGLTREQISDVEAAIASGAHGPILDVEDETGDGVRLTIE